MSQRRPFILLELMIAITLCMAFAFTLMRLPLQHLKNQVCRLYEMEIEREMSSQLHALQRDLFTRKIDPHAFNDEKKTFQITLNLDQKKPRQFSGVVHMKQRGHKVDTKGIECTLLEASIEVDGPKKKMKATRFFSITQ